MRKHTVAAAAAILITSIMRSALAGPVSFQQAVADYNAGRYSLALSEFESYKSAYPNNAQVHYYVALCHQSLNHIDAARAEYQWVSDRASGALKPMAAAGLARLSGAHSSSSSSSSSHVSNVGSTQHASSHSSSGPQAPAPTPSATPQLLKDQESFLVGLINRDRSVNGVSPPLKQSEKLSQLARAHAMDMVTNNFFDHTNKAGLNNGQRGAAAGIASPVHENLSRSYSVSNPLPNALITQCEDQMINEPPNQHNHRENLLGKYQSVGVGVVQSGGAITIVQEFCDENLQ